MQLIDETGNRHGQWKVLGRSDKPEDKNKSRWLCECDCGTQRVQNGTRLRNGDTKHCGCGPRKPHPRTITPEERERRKTEPRPCTKCLIVQPPENFYASIPNGHWCKKCRSDLAKNKPKVPYAWLMKRYGLTREDYLEKLNAQDGKCCICNEVPDPEFPLNVDHDHRLPAKDKMSHRGLLCKKCNTGIGALVDSVENLRRAADYLTFHNKRLDKLEISAI